MAADRPEEGVGENNVDRSRITWFPPTRLTDPEGVDIGQGKWSLSGDDAARFKLTGSTDNVRTLEFREKADFEMPADADEDNIYEVTVVASDGEEMAERSVTVKITDRDEAGMITLSSENPVTGTAITATLEDSDGDVINVAWTWHALDTASEAPSDDNDISKATTTSYTPVAGDIGMNLVAVARYMDRTEDEDNDPTMPAVSTAPLDGPTGYMGIRFHNRAISAVTAPVIDDPANARPEFLEGDTAVRYVEERSEADGDVRTPAETIGARLAIDDDDLPNDSHTYTLSGTDADSFDIGAGTGQLMTKPDVTLDYETKMTYTVIVTVEDGSGESNDTDSITVTIQVKGLDEKPEIQGEANPEYEEKGTGPVVTLSGSDPERVTPIVWSLPAVGTDPDGTDGDLGIDDVQDNGEFKINTAGELSFGTTPDYETPADDGDDNTYNAVVQASDGGMTTWVEYFKVTVTVLDVEEQGEVEWTVDPDGTGTEDIPEDLSQGLLEFQAGAVLAATVSDPDGGVTGTTWRWYRSSSISAMGTVISDTDDNPVSTNTYTVSDQAASNDVGMYLRAVATYTDSRTGDKTAEFVSPNPVQPGKQNQNSPPEFAPDTHNRRVQEGPAGMVVGAPVRAMDADGDVLNYSLGGAAETSFRINQETGQIETAVALNYDGDPAPDREFVVTVKATDSAGGNTGESGAANDDATVTITLLDVNEAPDFVDGDGVGDIPQNTEGMAADRPEEGVGAENMWTAPYTVATYTVDDPEGVDIGQGKWSLSGDDAARFQLTGSADNVRTLEFREKADFEMPADADEDNIYEVTVVASDGEEMAERSVTVKITDRDEAGMITLSSENPVTGTAITATLEDSDGDVINVAWTWHALDTASEAPSDDNDISKATTTSYTPVAGDIGMNLVAVARYMDRTEDEDNDPTMPAVSTAPLDGPTGYMGIRFHNRAISAVTAPVIDDPANARPEFLEGDTAVRYVEERSEADGDVRTPAETIGARLAIDDDDGVTAISHSFTLSGTDADSFDIGAGTGQLMTKPDVTLDYETKMTYTVIVMVEDSSNQPNDSDSITVTIEVKDLDERPDLMVGGLSVSGSPAMDYAEGGMGPVATYTAAGTLADMAMWTLEGDDDGAFSITGGVLTFNSTPDYETRADADMDNTYMVTVKADDGTYMDTQAVRVTVTNVVELGMLSGEDSFDYEETGTEAVGTYTTDGPVAPRWSLEGDDTGAFDIDGGMLTFKSSPDYETAADADMDNTYMVTVRADAGGEMDMMDVTVTVTDMDEPGMVSLSESRPVVGVALTATLSDPDGGVTGEMWQWEKSLDMSAWMEITGATTDSYNVMADDEGYYLRATVMYDDVHGTGKDVMATSDGTVTLTPDQMGIVALSPTRPSVGTEITATLSDPDGGVTGETWQWSRSTTMGGTFMDITGATSAMYTPRAEDDGYYLQATVTYDDAHGSGKMPMATTASMVTAGDPLIARYDANGNSMIDRGEVIQAINDYLSDGSISRPEVIEVINLYLSSS